VVVVGRRLTHRSRGVQTGRGVDPLVDHVRHDDVGRDRDHQAAGAPPHRARTLHLLSNLLAGELHVPGLFDDVDFARRAHHRQHVLPAHPVSLHDVENLFGDQNAAVGRFGGGERLERPPQLNARFGRKVRGGAHLFAGPGEHDRVPALVGDLRQGKLKVRARSVGDVLVAQHHLLQDHLEPDAGTHDRTHFVPGQRDLLLLGHLLPQRSSVQGAPLRIEPVQIVGQRRLPVHLLRRVVGQHRRRVEEAAGDVLLRARAGGRRDGRDGHSAPQGSAWTVTMKVAAIHGNTNLEFLKRVGFGDRRPDPRSCGDCPCGIGGPDVRNSSRTMLWGERSHSLVNIVRKPHPHRLSSGARRGPGRASPRLRG